MWRERESSYNINCSATDSRSNWVKTKLGSICKISSGKGIRKSEYLESGEYSIIGANGEIGRTDGYNNDHPVLTTGRVGTIGTIQRVNKAWITDNTLIIDIIDTSKVDYDYLYQFLTTVDFSKITTGNAQPLITSSSLKEVEIWVPSMEEQQRINSLVDSYDRLVEGQKHLLDIAIRESNYRKNCWKVIATIK